MSSPAQQGRLGGTHKAIAMTSVRTPLSLVDMPTIEPGAGEVLVRVLYTNSGPLDLHQADGGLLVRHPQVPGGGIVGRVVEVGSAQEGGMEAETWEKLGGKDLKKGDLVFGFAFGRPQEKAHQEFVTCMWYSLGRVPEPPPTGFGEGGREKWMQHLAASSTNFVTAVHTVTKDLGIALPWPKAKSEKSGEEGKDDAVLVWGGSSGVGMFVVQVLRYWGYENVVVAAGRKHHDRLREMGARACVDYRDGDVVEEIRGVLGLIPGRQDVKALKYAIDCIGSVEGSLTPLSKIVGKGTTVAVMLPVIVAHTSEERRPVYEMDVEKVLAGRWEEGVVLKGTRTHFYQENEFLRYNLQPSIIPTLLRNGAVKPTPVRLVEGQTMLERAEKALGMLRRGEVSGERLVWKVGEEDV